MRRWERRREEEEAEEVVQQQQQQQEEVEVACGKAVLLRSRCRLNLCACQRKLWSEESANRA